MKTLAKELVGRMSNLTALKSVEVALANTRLNLQYQKHTVDEITNDPSASKGESAIVIAAGPSLHRQDPVSQILESDYDGDLVCADGALPYCLRNGLVPDYVVTLDPHPKRIVRWFGDPELDQQDLDKDDYFKRQDLDPRLGEDELARNREMIELVNRHGPDIKLIVASCISVEVTTRCLDAGMKLYWWNPLYDDPSEPDSVTRQAYNINKAPCLATGGNCGASSWAFANSILKKRRVALVGMDLGYAPGTSLKKTQYYKEIAELFGNSADEAFINVPNPYTEEMWFTDPTYYWYREMFLDMVREADCETYNCTQGGIVFGEGVTFIPLSEFLGESSKKKVSA